MGMAGAGEVFTAGAEFHGGYRFSDEITGARSDNMDTEYSICFRIGQHLDASVSFTQGARAGDGHEGKSAFAILDTGSLQLFFGLPHRGDFRVRVTDADRKST